MSLDESSFDSSIVLVVEVLLLEGEFQFVVLMCADFPAAIARTVHSKEPQPISKESQHCS